MATIPSITSLRRRRTTYRRPTLTAAARHRRRTPRSERSLLYRASGTAVFWILAVAGYTAALAALTGALIGLQTETGRTVIAIIAVTVAAVWGIRWIEEIFTRKGTDA